MDAYRTVVSLLPKLNDQEKVKVLEKLKALKGAGLLPSESESPKSGLDVDLVLQVLCYTMQALGLEFTTSAQLKKAPGYSAFVRKVPDVMRFIRRVTTTRNQQRVFLKLGFTYLYNWMTKDSYPATSWRMMAEVHRIPSVINAAFPGYAESGLLGLLIGEEDVWNEQGREARTPRRRLTEDQ